MPKNVTPTFRDYADEYMSIIKHERTAGTLANYRWALGRYLLPSFGDLHLSSITKAVINRWIARMRDEGMSPQTLRTVYGCLRTMMRYADDEMEYLVWKIVIKKVASDKSKPRPDYSSEDFKKVVSLMPSVYHDALWVAVGASLRVGELCGLNSGDWNRAERALTIERSLTRGKLTETKTKTVEDVYPLGFAAEILDRITGTEVRKARDWSAMFIQDDGRRLHPTTLRKHWLRATRAAGLPGMHVHDLRHLGLSTFARSGATLAEIQSHGRHKDQASALRYQHAGNADRRRQLSEKATAEF